MAYRLAERLDVLVHFHLAETAHEISEFRRQHGQDLVPALDAVGFLGPRLVAAHGIWLTDDDARLLASRGVTISHCPASNMKLGSGWSDGGRPGAALPVAARGRRAGGAGHRRRRRQQQPRHVRDHEAGGAAAEAHHRRSRHADRPRGLRHGHRRRRRGAAHRRRPDRGGAAGRPGAGRSRPALPGARARPGGRPGLRRAPGLRGHRAGRGPGGAAGRAPPAPARRSWPTPGRRMRRNSARELRARPRSSTPATRPPPVLDGAPGARRDQPDMPPVALRRTRWSLFLLVAVGAAACGPSSAKIQSWKGQEPEGTQKLAAVVGDPGVDPALRGEAAAALVETGHSQELEAAIAGLDIDARAALVPRAVVGLTPLVAGGGDRAGEARAALYALREQIAAADARVRIDAVLFPALVADVRAGRDAGRPAGGEGHAGGHRPAHRAVAAAAAGGSGGAVRHHRRGDRQGGRRRHQGPGGRGAGDPGGQAAVAARDPAAGHEHPGRAGAGRLPDEGGGRIEPHRRRAGGRPRWRSCTGPRASPRSPRARRARRPRRRRCGTSCSWSPRRATATRPSRPCWR